MRGAVLCDRWVDWYFDPVDQLLIIGCNGCGRRIEQSDPGGREVYYHCDDCDYDGWVTNIIQLKPAA